MYVFSEIMYDGLAELADLQLQFRNEVFRSQLQTVAQNVEFATLIQCQTLMDQKYKK